MTLWWELPDHSEIRAALMEIQEGACALCPATGRLVIDHDHKTGLIRGLLCKSCNDREGRVRSSLFQTVADEAMLAYLANPPAAGRGWIYGPPEPEGPSQEEVMAALMAVKLPELPPLPPRKRKSVHPSDP